MLKVMLLPVSLITPLVIIYKILFRFFKIMLGFEVHIPGLWIAFVCCVLCVMQFGPYEMLCMAGHLCWVHVEKRGYPMWNMNVVWHMDFGQTK